MNVQPLSNIQIGQTVSTRQHDTAPQRQRLRRLRTPRPAQQCLTLNLGQNQITHRPPTTRHQHIIHLDGELQARHTSATEAIELLKTHDALEGNLWPVVALDSNTDDLPSATGKTVAAAMFGGGADMWARLTLLVAMTDDIELLNDVIDEGHSRRGNRYLDAVQSRLDNAEVSDPTLATAELRVIVLDRAARPRNGERQYIRTFNEDGTFEQIEMVPYG